GECTEYKLGFFCSYVCKSGNKIFQLSVRYHNSVTLEFANSGFLLLNYTKYCRMDSRLIIGLLVLILLKLGNTVFDDPCCIFRPKCDCEISPLPTIPPAMEAELRMALDDNNYKDGRYIGPMPGKAKKRRRRFIRNMPNRRHIKGRKCL
uniref:Uncharacterized protein n=1 Tax=Romanomermis culicivorax TaxID=13658 RepID=A0A915JRA9_ROMCU